MLNRSLFYNKIDTSWIEKNVPRNHVWKNLYLYGLTELSPFYGIVFEEGVLSNSYPAIPIMYYVIREHCTQFYLSMRDISVRSTSVYERLKRLHLDRVEDICKHNHASEDLMISVATLTYLMLRSSFISKEMNHEVSFMSLEWTGLANIFLPREELKLTERFCKQMYFSDLAPLNFMNRYKFHRDDLVVLNLEREYIDPKLLDVFFKMCNQKGTHVIIKINERLLENLFMYSSGEYKRTDNFYFKDGVATNFTINNSFVHHIGDRYATTFV